MKQHDNSEAMRLADELVAPIGTQTSYQTAHEAAALLRKLPERIAELEAERDRLREELAEQAAIYGAATHIHSELRSIVQAGGSDEAIGREFRKRALSEIADAFASLRGEVERLRVDAERWREISAMTENAEHTLLKLADENEQLEGRLRTASDAFQREQDRADAAEIKAETAQAAERDRWCARAIAHRDAAVMSQYVSMAECMAARNALQRLMDDAAIDAARTTHKETE